MKGQFALLLSLSSVAAGFLQEAPRDVPESLKAPANERLVLHARAKGFQIYGCQEGAGQKFEWALKAPEAKLFDEKGTVIGTHFAGPTWRLNDGSEVTGKVAAKKDAPEANAIPWLLLSAAGNAGAGILSHVTTIQRVHTVGGLPPDTGGCDPSKKGTELKREYSADYYFYAPTRP